MTDLTQHWRLAFENKFLGAWNLWKDGRYSTATVTIDRITRETITMQGGRKEPATLVYFKGKRVPLILTKTMGKAIQAMHGPVPAADAARMVATAFATNPPAVSIAAASPAKQAMAHAVAVSW